MNKHQGGRPGTPWGHEGPPWQHGRRGPRPHFFIMFMVVFGVIALLVVGGMAAMALLLTRYFGGDGPVAVAVWLAGCGVAAALPLLAVSLAIYAYRGIARPLGDIVDAADAVAGGDLTVRVAEDDRGPFGRLARTFNRMLGELARADEQRRHLTADVAHELRTPMHIIQGNLEGLLDGVYSPTDEHLTMLLDETRQLGRLVDDLQTLSLAESGQLTLDRQKITVGELLTDLATSFIAPAEAAGIDLHLALDEDVSATKIEADAGRLDQVLGNLVVNALRHTPAGGTITLGATAVNGESDGDAIALTVADTGEGIPPDDLAYIFDRFWRGDRARRHVDGAGGGLGLAIARQLVQLHGGDITVASAPGQGATFTVHLPRAA